MLELWRHDLVWLDKKLHISQTSSSDYPYVVTQQHSSIAPDMLRVAFQYSMDKSVLSRKSFIVPKSTIICHQRPLLFTRVLAKFNLLVLQSVLEQLTILGITVCIYGSFAWQYLTGVEYVTLQSDLDLLFYFEQDLSKQNNVMQCKNIGVDYMAKVHSLLLELDALSPYAVDGELVFPHGRFVAWREWFSTAADVLVKTTTEISCQNKHGVVSWY